MRTKSEQQKNNIRNEIVLMSLCQNENIIKYHDGYLFKEKFWIFLEYMNLGSLTDVIDSGIYKTFNENIIQYIVYQILNGLNYLHKRFIIHRDIKSDNVLINFDGDIKVADFGYAAQLT